MPTAHVAWNQGSNPSFASATTMAKLDIEGEVNCISSGDSQDIESQPSKSGPAREPFFFSSFFTVLTNWTLFLIHVQRHICLSHTQPLPAP